MDKDSTLGDYIEDDEVNPETGTTKKDDAEILCAIDPDQVRDFVPERFLKLPKEKQPVFHIKILSAREAAELENNAVNTTTQNDRQVIRIMGGTMTLKALEKGCKGWTNWNYSNGKPALFRENNGKPRPDTFDCLPMDLRQEIAQAITRGKGLTEQEAKNSD